MPKESTYTATLPDADGVYAYTAEEDAVWSELFQRQMTLLEGKACDEYFDGVARLGLSADRVPQLGDIDRRLATAIGFGVEGVPALIAPSRFFQLLSEGKFPLATFIRRREHIDYIEEPDIFHEVFGHCPLLTNPSYARFVRRFGENAVALGKDYSWHLFRIFWFTVEFGLIRERGQTRIYGSGLISSHGDAANALGDRCRRLPFDLDAVLAQPFEIDHFQDDLVEIASFDQLFEAVEKIERRRVDSGAAGSTSV